MATYSGTIDLRVTGDAEEKTKKIERSVKSLKDLVRGLKPIPNLFDNRTQDKDIRKLKEELKKLVGEYGKGTGAGRRFSNTLAGLNSQISAFGKIIGNVNVNSDEFVSAITAQEKASRRLAKAEAERLKVQAQVNTANTVGRATSVQETLDLGKVIPKSIAGLELYQRELQETFRNVEIGSESYRELRNEILRVNALMRDFEMNAPAPSSPIGGRTDIPGSPAALAADRRAREQRRSQRGRDILTGAGFPLLFGGGPAQALAGGIGGAFGGLGGSVAASAIASQVEAFATAAAEAGVALTSTGGALEFVREKSLFTSEGSKELAAQLEEQGDVAGLASLLTEELVSQIGNSGVIALQDLGSTTNKTTKLWNQLTTQLQILIAGPLNGFLQLVNNVIGGINDALKPTAKDDFRAIRDRVFASGDAEAIARVTAIEDQVRGVQRKNLRGGETQVTQGGLTEEAASRGVELLKAAGFGPQIAVTDEDRRTITPPSGKTKKERKSRLPELQAEVDLTERLNVLSRAIAEARRQEDPVREAALKMEQELEKLATKTQKIRLEDIPVAEQDEKIKQAKLQADQKIFDINDRLKTLREDEAKRNAEILSGLEDKGILLQAKLDGNLEEIQLEQEIQKLLEDNKNLDETSLRATIEKNKALEEQVRIQEKLDQVYASIGQSISTGIVDSLTAAVEGTKSLAEVAANTLRNVANILLQFGVNTALGGIGGAAGANSFLGKLFSGFRASGGSVSGGRSYVVGERGPELFVPNTSGTVVPSGKFGGATNVVVNVDAKGTSASGDGGQAKQLGGLIGAAVQAELIKQQRPGGLLAR